MNWKRRYRNGFTLIELLVVIAIISLLVSILLPSLQQAKELAKSAVCMTNLRSLGMCIQMYVNDYEVLPDYPGVSTYEYYSFYYQEEDIVDLLCPYADSE